MVFFMAAAPASAAPPKDEQARIHLRIGDFYAARRQPLKASDHYLKALHLDRRALTLEERYRLALHFGSNKRLEDAVAELKLLLEKQPEHVDARVALARYLAWSGRLKEAIVTAEAVLQRRPEHGEARLIIANAASWKGDYQTAIAMYRQLLQNQEDPATRVGLTHALINTGDYEGARESRAKLESADPTLLPDVEQISRALRQASRRHAELAAENHSDTDDNVRTTHTLRGRWPVERGRVSIEAAHTKAEAPTRRGTADQFSVQGVRRYAPALQLQAALGAVRSATRTRPAGMVGLQWHRGDWDMTLQGRRKIYTDTAQLMENDIRAYEGVVRAHYTFIDALAIDVSCWYADFSDGNRGMHWQVTPWYIVRAQAPRIVLGLSHEYQSYARQTDGGYYDPRSLAADRLLIAVSAGSERWEGTMQIHAGTARFEESGARGDNASAGGYATVRYRPTPRASLSVQVEGSNSALTTVSGYRYFSLGLQGQVDF